MTGADTRLLTINETAVRLRCSRAHVYRLITSGDLTITDIAGAESRKSKTRVREDGLARYIAGHSRLVTG